MDVSAFTVAPGGEKLLDRTDFPEVPLRRCSKRRTHRLLRSYYDRSSHRRMSCFAFLRSSSWCDELHDATAIPGADSSRLRRHHFARGLGRSDRIL